MRAHLFKVYYAMLGDRLVENFLKHLDYVLAKAICMLCFRCTVPYREESSCSPYTHRSGFLF
jgi:hypothetical protein